MNVENRVYPEPEQLQRLRGYKEADGPIVMVNLLKFRDRAHYPDGSDAHLSGRDAYVRYARAVAGLVESVGGKVLFAGAVTSLTLGRVDELWDEVALAEYPSRADFLRMMMSPELRAIEVHRAAGLEGQLNIETVPNASEILDGRE